MFNRRPPREKQRYQPLPAGQKVIILTDKTQFMPKEFEETGEQPGTPTEGKAPSGGKKQNSIPALTQAVEKDGRCRVIYSIDMLEAFLVIEPPQGGKWPDINEATAVIEQEELIGYDQNAVAEAIERHRTNPVLIARGRPAVNGRDTELKINYELKDLHKIYIEDLVPDKNGRVDYHKVKTVQTVTIGDIVAVKIMCDPGEDGMDVHGRIIPAVPGVDRPIKLGKNVKWDDEGLNVIATASGKPTLISNLLSVLPIHEIHGDVNFHTGNICFDGDIIIHGNVENGFKVEAGGDIVIMGYVDAAAITAGGKLSVKGRVFGNDKGKLICEGDFFAKEIERATVVCKGTVTVQEAIIHSHVFAEKKVAVESGKGWIVGGLIHAGEEISARAIGSRLGIITDIEVGPTYKPRMVNLQSLETGATTFIEETASCENLSEIQADSSVQVTAEMEATFKTKGRIRFKDVIYPGVRVTFESYKFIIQNELTFGSLTCSAGYLHLLPYR